MKRIFLFILLGTTALESFAQTISDVDGNSYNTVSIGTQVWIKENLKTTKFNDGVAIPLVRIANDWKTKTTPAYCWFNNDSVAYKNTFGALYNWYTINSNKLCPTGWHVPSDADWNTLADNLGGKSVAGSKLKEVGSSHWSILNTSATNSSGFTALPGGYRGGYDGAFGFISNYGAWWSTAAFSADLIIVYTVFDNEVYMSSEYNVKNNGHYVRCVKDMTTSIATTSLLSEPVLYPNPVKDKLYLKNVNTGATSISIYDLHGKPLMNKLIDTESIDLSGFSNGLYLVRFTDAESVRSYKLVIE